MKKIIKFLFGVRKELERIRWTSKKDLIKYSLATFLFVIFFGIFFYTVDLLVALIKTLV